MAKGPSRLDISHHVSPHAPEGRALAVVGEVDAHTAEALRTALAELGDDGDVSVALGGVTFIDSSGLSVLIGAHTALADHQHRLILESPGPIVLRLFELTGLTPHLHLV
jgi:anti-sigma B factor antagonist